MRIMKISNRFNGLNMAQEQYHGFSADNDHCVCKWLKPFHRRLLYSLPTIKIVGYGKINDVIVSNLDSEQEIIH